MDSIINNALFGIFLTLLAFELGVFIFRKTKIALLNPILIATTFIIAILLLFNIDYDTYNNGAKFINSFLGPATVILAVPLYKQINLLKKHVTPILAGIFIGTLVSICCVIILGALLGVNSDLIASMVPKSVTTPIGVEVSTNIGGISAITIVCIVITGITGAVIAPTIFKIFKIEDEVAIGIAIGTSAHALGTSKALEMGEVEGAMSSLSIGIAGLMTVFLAPPIYLIASKILGL